MLSCEEYSSSPWSTRDPLVHQAQKYDSSQQAAATTTIDHRRSFCFLMMPVEIQAMIFEQLAPADLIRASLVCQNWSQLIKEDFIWYAVYQRYFGGGELAGPAHHQQAATTAAATTTNTVPSRRANTWRERSLEATRKLHLFFGDVVGLESQEMGPSSSSSDGGGGGGDFCNNTKDLERIYQKLLWATDNGYSKIVDRVLQRAREMSPSSANLLVNYRWKTSIFPSYSYPGTTFRHHSSSPHVCCSSSPRKVSCCCS